MTQARKPQEYKANRGFIVFCEYQGYRFFNSRHAHYPDAFLVANALSNEFPAAHWHISDKPILAHGERGDFEAEYAA